MADIYIFKFCENVLVYQYIYTLLQHKNLNNANFVHLEKDNIFFHESSDIPQVEWFNSINPEVFL